MSGAELALTQGGKRPEAGKLEAEIESVWPLPPPSPGL